MEAVRAPVPVREADVSRVRAFELDLGDRLVRLATDGIPSASEPSARLATDVYTSPERLLNERRTMARRPAAAVASSEIASPGDFATLRLGDVPVIVTRERDGRAHALVNVCAHRGNTVEHRPCGSARLMSCRFHGWSYNLDGTLRAASDARLFSTTPAVGGLQRLRCEERHGLVWVTVDPGSDPLTVRDWLGVELDDLLAGLGLGAMVCHAAEDHDLGCNWKMLTDGFLEIYHLKYLHRNTIAPYFPAHAVVYSRYGDHLLAALPKNRLWRELPNTPRDQWRILEGLTMAIALVPGTVIQWQAGHVELFSLRPDPHDPTRTSCRLTMLVPAEQAHDTDLWDRNWQRVCETIPAEDFAVAEEVQGNINAGVVASLQIGANESLIFEHLAALDRLIAS